MAQQGSGDWWGNLATLLAFNVGLGIIGLDRFYRGQTGLGVLKLVTLGGVFVWWIVDAAIGVYRFGQTGQWTRPATDVPSDSPRPGASG